MASNTETERGNNGSRPNSRNCRACKLPMPFDANKCVECSSLQNWKRYLNFSNSVLSLMVALVSVLTFAIPVWKDVLIPKAASPVAALVEVNNTGLATFVVSNDGNTPMVLEQILVGTNEAVVRMNLDVVPSDEKVIKPDGISVFPLRLSIENNVDSIWELVKLFRMNDGCQTQVGVITPDGMRGLAIVDISTAGISEPENEEMCAQKVIKLITKTLKYLGDQPDYVETFCKVAELHPRDSSNPRPGNACK